MTKQFRLVCVASFLFVLAVCLGCFASGSGRASVTSPASGAAATESHPPQTGAGKDVCLGCHGPFDELIERTAKYVAPSGETTSPHRYLPHKETAKEARSLPDCGNCHQTHPVPPAPSDLAALPKPKVEWCYKKCHHTKDFTPCMTCHPSRTPGK